MATSGNSQGQEDRTSRQVLSVPTAWSAHHQGLTPSKGFPNTTVMCYRNSALIFLLCSPVLVNWLASHYGDKGCEIPCIRCQLHCLAVSFWQGVCDGKEKETALSRVWRTLLRGRWEKKNIERQQDVREFIEGLFGQIRDETPEEELFEMQNLLMITAATRFECKECGHTREGLAHQEYFCIVQFPEGLESTESVNIKNMLSACYPGSFVGTACRQCQCAQEFRTEAITDIPEVLLVHLNRVIDPINGCKVLNRVTLGEQIVLPESLRRGLIDTGEVHYELYSVIFHNGLTIHQGHYSVAAKDPSGKWWVVNDDKNLRSFESLETLMKSGNGMKRPSIMAYVCAYRRLPLEGGPAPLDDNPNLPHVGESVPPKDDLTPAQVDESASTGEVPNQAHVMALNEPPATNLAATVPQTENAPSTLVSPVHSPVRPGVTMDGNISLDGRDTVWTIQQHLPMPFDAGPLIKLKPNGRVQHASIRLVFTSGEEVLEGNVSISLKPRTSKTQKQESVKTMNTKQKKTAQANKSKAPTSGEPAKPQGVRKSTRIQTQKTEKNAKSKPGTNENTGTTRRKKAKQPSKKAP